MMNYDIEELLPVVAELTEKYTAKESTSVSYEKARQLMEAVIYCINHAGDPDSLVSTKGVAAKEAYKRGYEKLIRKVKETQIVYNEMIEDFCAYGNENYYDTVTKAIPGFFQHYDVCFAPQETIITMDYPTLRPVTDRCGIDAIAEYVEYISYEQRFMGALPQEYVCEILYRYQTGYRKQFYNICSVILRHILGHMMIGKSLGEAATEEDYTMLRNMILMHDVLWLEKNLTELLDKLIEKKYKGDKRLLRYLQTDLGEYITQIRVGAHNNSIQRGVIL